MYRLLTLVLLVLVALLQMKLWQGEGSWTSEQALKQQVEEQNIENARLKQRNAALVAEVEDLKNGEAAVEERARSEMGMVKPGETFYRVVEPADANATMAPEDVPEDAASPESGQPSSGKRSSGQVSSSQVSSSQVSSSPPSSPAASSPARVSGAVESRAHDAARPAPGPASPPSPASKK